MENLSKSQVQAALDVILQYAPEEAQNIEMFKPEIIDLITSNAAPATNSILSTVQYASVITPEMVMAENDMLTPCMKAVGVVVVDVVFIVIGLVGIHAKATDKAALYIIKGIPDNAFIGLRRAMAAIQRAEGIIDNGKALASFFGALYKMGCLRMFFQYLKNEMRWWEWLKTAIICIAQIIAWVATECVALAAEIALCVMQVEQTVEDVVKAVNTCRSDSNVLLAEPC